MIAAERTLVVASSADQCWAFVQVIGNWANQMPGYVSHRELGPDDSEWTLNVDMGPFSRAVQVDVHVKHWFQGIGADFTLKAPYEPFHGEGSIRLTPEAQATRIELRLATEVTGPMSKVLTAMATPVLQKVADEFSANLSQALGGGVAQVSPPAANGLFRRCWRWLRRLLEAA